MKNSFSLFRRILVTQGIFTLILIFLFLNTDPFTDETFVYWKLPIISIALSAFHMIYILLVKRSLLQLLFTKRLPFTQLQWNTITYLLAGLYLTLALAVSIVAYAATFETWVNFKLLAPIISLIIFSIAVPKFLRV